MSKGFIFQPAMVAEQTKYKIKCVAQWHELIFCGCNDNALRIFMPHISAQGTHSYKCIFEDAKFGKNISQLEIVDYYDLLIAIIDETVYFYKITGNYAQYNERVNSRNNLLSNNNNSHSNMNNGRIAVGKLMVNVKLLFDIQDSKKECVLVSCSKAWSKGEQRTLLIGIGQKKSVQLFQWMNKGMKASDYDNPLISEVLKKINIYPLPEKPRCMIFAAKNLIVGFKNQYDLLQLEDASKRTIFQTGTSKKAVGIRTTNKEVLLVVDRQGFFIHYDGSPARTDCIEWSDVPNELLYAFPYVIAVLPKCIEVHHSDTFVHLASYDFKSGKYGSYSCYESNDNIWRSYISVSSSNDLMSLNMGGITEQLRDLVSNKHFSEAAYLCQQLESEQFEIEGLDKTIKMKDINELFAYDLFNNYKFKEAVVKFEESKVSPRRIISLFSSLVPPGQCRKALRHPVDVTFVHKTQKLLKEAITQFLRPYLVSIRKQIEEHVAKGGKLDNLQLYESKDDYDINDWPLIELIDTVYMKCLLHTNEEALQKFLTNTLKEPPNASHDRREVNCFKLPNQCNVEECESVLRSFRNYSEMVSLYKSHNQYRKALELMKIKSAETGGVPKTIEYLQELGQNESNEKLVLHFSEWVLKDKPDEGLRIFSGKPFGSTIKDGSDLRLPAISSTKILDHLERIRCDISTRIGYLEMLIYEAKDTATIFHDELIKLYLKKILEAMDEETNEQAASRNKYGLAPGDIVELTEQYNLGLKYGYVQPGEIAQVLSILPNVSDRSLQVQVMFLEFDSTTTKVPISHIRKSNREIRIRPEKQTGTVAELRKKLINFLKKSRYFNPNNMLKVFPPSILLEEQAWLRSRIPQHKEALEIIVYKLEDGDMAEEYCDVVWQEFQDHLSDLQATLTHQAEALNKRAITSSSSNIAAIGGIGSMVMGSMSIPGSMSTKHIMHSPNSGVGSNKFFPMSGSLHHSGGIGGPATMGVGGASGLSLDGNMMSSYQLPKSAAAISNDIAHSSLDLNNINNTNNSSMMNGGSISIHNNHNIAALDLSSQSSMFHISELAMNQALNESKWIEARDIYLILLEVYLVAPLHSNDSIIMQKNVENELENPWLSRALKMLVKKHDRVDIIAVLNKLPNKLGMSQCFNFMDAVIKSKYEKKRTNQVTKNLLFQTATKLQCRKSYREEDFQTVTDATVCKKCKKRIGQSAFLRYPDGNVFHYICVKQQQNANAYGNVDGAKFTFSLDEI